MKDEIKDIRVTILMSPSELKAVDDWSFAHRIRSRGEAIRLLIDAGLIIPTIASMVTSNAASYTLKEDVELFDGLKKLEKVVQQHFDKLPA